MSESITVWLPCDGKASDDAGAYLKSLGIGLQCEPGDDIAFIEVELREVPKVFGLVEGTGYCRSDEVAWQVESFSDRGISLYFVAENVKTTGQQYRERTIFIPWSNIVAIHNIDERFLSASRSMADRRDNKRN